MRNKCKAFERLHELRVQLFFLLPYVFTCARLLNAPELSVCFEKVVAGSAAAGASVSAGGSSSSAASRAAELAHAEALYSALLSGSVPLPASVPSRGALSAVHAILALFEAFPRHWRLQHLHNARKLLLALRAREAFQQQKLAASAGGARQSEAFGPLSLPFGGDGPSRSSPRARDDAAWPGDSPGPHSLLRPNGDGAEKPELVPVRTSRTVADSYLTYSLSDILVCLSPNGSRVLNQLQRVVQALREHVSRECALCSLLGFYCEFCSTLNASCTSRSLSLSVSVSLPHNSVASATANASGTAATRSASSLLAIPTDNRLSKAKAETVDDADAHSAPGAIIGSHPHSPASAAETDTCEPPEPRAHADSASGSSADNSVSATISSPSPLSTGGAEAASGASKQQQQQKRAPRRESPLFPFDCERVAQCFECHACFHSDCLAQAAASEEPECPKCSRLRARRIGAHSSAAAAARGGALRAVTESNAQF